MLINCVRNRISAREAASRLRGPVRELRLGRFVVAVEFFVPYRCFDVNLKNGKDSDRFLMAIDSASGRLDPWKLDERTLSEDRALVETRNVADEKIPETNALELLEGLTRRATYLKGFFKVRDINLKARFVETLYVPYWVGIFERSDKVRLEAINGVTGMHEGAKLREVITAWFQDPR